MKSPTTGKNMILIEEPLIIKYQGKTVRYMSKSFLCVDSGETYTTTELDEFNLKRMKYEYEKI